MRKFRIAAAVVTAAALLVLPSTGVQAGLPGVVMEAEPNSGFPGDSFVVHNLDGSECFGNRVDVTVDGPAPFGNEEATDASFKGDWEVSFTVPPGSTPGPYPINATCSLQGKGSYEYAPVTYTVLGQEPSPSPSPSPEPSPSPSEDPDVGAEREEAPAAQPEVEAAAFTG